MRSLLYLRKGRVTKGEGTALGCHPSPSYWPCRTLPCLASSLSSCFFLTTYLHRHQHEFTPDPTALCDNSYITNDLTDLSSKEKDRKLLHCHCVVASPSFLSLSLPTPLRPLIFRLTYDDIPFNPTSGRLRNFINNNNIIKSSVPTIRHLNTFGDSAHPSHPLDSFVPTYKTDNCITRHESCRCRCPRVLRPSTHPPTRLIWHTHNSTQSARCRSTQQHQQNPREEASNVGFGSSIDEASPPC